MSKLCELSPGAERRKMLSRAISGASRPIVLLSPEFRMLSASRSARELMVAESVEALAKVTAEHLMLTPLLLFNFTKERGGSEPLIASIPTTFGFCPAAIMVNGDGDTVVIFLPELELLIGCEDAELVKRRILRLLTGFADAISYVENVEEKRVPPSALDKLDALDQIILRAAEQPLEVYDGECKPINKTSFDSLNGASRRITAEDILEGAEKASVRLSDEVRKLLHAADAIYQREEEIAGASAHISSHRFLMIIFEAISVYLERVRGTPPKVWMEENDGIMDIYIMGDFSEKSTPLSFAVTELLLRALGAVPYITTVNGFSCLRLRVSVDGDYLFYVRKTEEGEQSESENFGSEDNDESALSCGIAEKYLKFMVEENVID